jgi:hypothetical protein
MDGIEIKMIQTKTFAVVLLIAIAAIGATAIGTGIFLQHGNAANAENIHCAPNNIATCTSPGGPFGGSSLNSLQQANSITEHVNINPRQITTSNISCFFYI